MKSARRFREVAVLVAAVLPCRLTAQQPEPRTGRYAAVSAGSAVTCALDRDGRAYCWGENDFGELGSGPGAERCRHLGPPIPCSTRPARVPTTATFTAIAAGGFSCGLTSEGAAWCWGPLPGTDPETNAAIRDCGTLDRTPCARRPVLVSGSLRFGAITVGLGHACALTLDGLAYCWGRNDYGQLGIGGRTEEIAAPRPVRGNLRFGSLDAGATHTCGVTMEGAAYCWGADGYGQLGDSAAGRWDDKPAPVPVRGGMVFQSVSAGRGHTCGIVRDGAAFCWGDDYRYELGAGADLREVCRRFTSRVGPGRCSTVPLRVAGGITFASISAGAGYTCAVSPGGMAYCWGSDPDGKLGVSAPPEQCGDPSHLLPCVLSPLAVSGGRTFSAVSAGDGHTCGIAADGQLYCWGAGEAGQLGARTRTDSREPLRVIPPPPAGPVRVPGTPR